VNTWSLVLKLRRKAKERLFRTGYIGNASPERVRKSLTKRGGGYTYYKKRRPLSGSLSSSKKKKKK